MTTSNNRLANWDLLRALAMLFVVAVHTQLYIGGVSVCDLQEYGLLSIIMKKIFIICDPVFFMLSGYFALRPQKRGLKDYYLNKVSTIILPLFLYSIMFYLYTNRAALTAISVSGYFDFFASKLASAWWFIPTLIPCLAAAPFINKGLEYTDDKTILKLGIAIAAISAWGMLLITVSWLGAQLNAPILTSFSKLCLQLIPPGLLTTSLYYFQFFIMGGVFRRLEPQLHGKAGNWLIVAGFILWLQDILFAVLSIPSQDPSCSWLFTAFAIMILFSRIQICARPAARAISWTAQRSYSIYLIQYSTLSLMAGLITALPIQSNTSPEGIVIAFAVWIMHVVGAYAVALIIASICDPLILSNMQKLFCRLTSKNMAKCPNQTT